MAKGRILLKQISCSKRQSQLKTDKARLLYTWMLAHLDRNGSFWGDELLVKAYVVPYLEWTSKEVKDILMDLAEKNLIILYAIDDKQYLNVPDFVEKQTRIEPNEKPRFPLLPKESKKVAGLPPESRQQLAGKSLEVKQSKVKQKTLKTSAAPEAAAYFYQKYAETQGKAYTPNYGRDRKELGTLLSAMDLPALKHKIDCYFLSKDVWFIKNGYDIPTFKNKINAIKVEKKVSPEAEIRELNRD